MLCGKGTYGPSPGLTICVDCEKGKSQWVAGKTSCTDCQAGRANAKVKSTTADACIKCKKGNVENQIVDIWIVVIIVIWLYSLSVRSSYSCGSL